MPLFSIFALAMMMTLIIILALLAMLSEAILYRSVRRFRHSRRTAYYIISGTALSLYFILFIAGRLTDYSAVWFAFLGNVAIIIFMLNALCKIIFAAAELLRRATSNRGWITAAMVVCATLTLLLFYGLFIERNRLLTEEIELSFEHLPTEADGLRIVQVADIHVGRTLGRYRLLRQTVDKIDALHPDIVIFCGDLINVRPDELDSTVMAILGKVSAERGIYSVIGNHDNGMYIVDTVKMPREECLRRIVEKERAMGWTVLIDETEYLTFGNDSIALTGLDYPAELRKGSHGRELHQTDYDMIYADVPDGVFNITIAHYPTVWEHVTACGKADLTLAGHVHAMQLKIPVGSRGWSPAALVYKYWSGLYCREGRYLNISDGAGSGIPIRIGTPPEITLITLRRQ